jgi:small redox-active disulfide protein 2
VKIQILGSGCPKCQALAENTRQAAAQAGLEAEIEKVTDKGRIMEMGVLITPGLAVDGVLKSSGRLLSVDQIAALLAENSPVK